MSVPYIERSITVVADPSKVYELAKNMEAFPQYMPDVREVTVIDRQESSMTTRWRVHVIGRDFRWTERDEFDDAKPSIRYTQIEGDIKKFEGEWRFIPLDNESVRVELTCDAELGVPMLDSLFNPVLKKAMEMNIDKMLQGIKSQAEESNV